MLVKLQRSGFKAYNLFLFRSSGKASREYELKGKINSLSDPCKGSKPVLLRCSKIPLVEVKSSKFDGSGSRSRAYIAGLLASNFERRARV